LNVRDLIALEEASSILVSLPVASARQIGLYYQALAIRRKGQPDQAKLLFETVADNGPLAYRARAIQSLGFIHREQGQLDEAMRLYLEALRAAPDNEAGGLLTTLMAHLEVSIIKSISGDHQRALDSLEKLSPLVRLVAAQDSYYFYAYHNALAVELGELGRIAEADKILVVALSSPFAPAHPEWSETHNELEAKRDFVTPSQIAFSRAPEVIPSPRAGLHRSPKPERAAAFYQLICEPSSFQIPFTLLAAVAVITAVGESRIILDRLEEALRPRAPPALLNSSTNF
jgi:tetratricopeptide (TPR) repeat protein